MASVVVRAGLFGCLAGAGLLLAACAGRDPYVSGALGSAGEWGTEKHTDRITGAPMSNSYLATRKVSYGAILIPPPARLQLMCFKDQPAVLVSFDFKIGSTRNAEVAYRFDEKPGHEPHVRIIDDHKAVLIDDPRRWRSSPANWRLPKISTCAFARSRPRAPAPNSGRRCGADDRRRLCELPDKPRSAQQRRSTRSPSG